MISSDRTKETYEKSAKELAEYFRGIGSREEDIDRAFELVRGNTESYVLELGCGDGRDAQSILRRTKNLTAIDYSNNLINIAKQTNPESSESFLVADILTYEPQAHERYDIVFAFASLLHINPIELKATLEKYLNLLTPHGVFYISMKMNKEYREAIKEDNYGWRVFHLYHPDELVEMLPSDFKEVFRKTHRIGETDWFELAFQEKTESKI